MKSKKKVTDHNHDEYITTPEFNKFTAESFATTKTDFNTKLISSKINLNMKKHVLVENEFKKLQTFDSIYFRGKSHFEEGGTQNYLLFQPMHRYFKGLLVLVVLTVFIFGNLKDCLMKILYLLLNLIISLLPN